MHQTMQSGVDVPIYFPNAIEKFKEFIEELKTRT